MAASSLSYQENSTSKPFLCGNVPKKVQNYFNTLRHRNSL